MSRRKRQPQKGTETGQIEWLKHRKGYPTAAEREKILELRRQLSVELIGLAVSRADRNDSRFQALINKYGKDEVLRAEQTGLSLTLFAFWRGSSLFNGQATG
jgi:hypothetical protein